MQVVYVTATAPYIFIVILLVRAALLPGSWDGVKYYLTPQFNQLARPQVKSNTQLGDDRTFLVNV